MIKKNYREVENKEATLTDGTPVKNVYVRWVINKEDDGAQNFAMRRFEIRPDTKVHLHNHPQDHEIYILSGKGRFYDDSGKDEVVGSGDVLYIPPFENHGIDNLSEEDLVFICLIPYLKK